jgi:hypothetical protein
MKKSMRILLILAVICTALGFTQKQKNIKPSYCGPHLTLNNYGSVSIRDIYMINLSTGYDITLSNVATGTSTYVTQWSQQSTISVKLLLNAPQNGSIKIYRNGILIDCHPTSSSGSLRYDFDIECYDCDYYTIEVVTSPC